MEDRICTYWQDFLLKTNRDKETKCLEVFYFGHNEQSAAHLLELVLRGTKKATASCHDQYKLTNCDYPKTGDLSIVTDFNGNPRCIIETKNVSYLPFNKVTYDICKREGEDDNLDTWRKNHIDFFTSLGQKLGFKFSFDMDVIFEDFEVIYR